MKAITLKKQIDTYLQTKANLKPGTLRCYRSLFHSIKDDDIMDIPVKKLKSSHIKIWMVDKKNQGRKQSTINSYYTGLIKPALQMALEDGFISRNPASFNVTSVVKTPVSKSRSLTPEEVALVESKLSEDTTYSRRNRNMILTCLYLGLRVSELAALTVNDINFERNEVTVTKQLYENKKELSIGTPKTKSGVRKIPMTSKARAVLKDATDQVKQTAEVDGYSGFLFTNKYGLPLGRSCIQKRYYWLSKILDEEYGTNLMETSIHTLRHTFCTQLIKQGVNLKVVQYVMGHKTPNITLEIYSHVSADFVHDELKKTINAI